MKIYVAHSSGFNYKDELYKPLRNSNLYNTHNFILPHEKRGDAVNSKKIISECDLVIAEVSYPSTGLGIELGWAEMIKIPVICLHRESRKISSSLPVLFENIISYKSEDNLLEKINDHLKKLC